MKTDISRRIMRVMAVLLMTLVVVLGGFNSNATSVDDDVDVISFDDIVNDHIEEQNNAEVEVEIEDIIIEDEPQYSEEDLEILAHVIMGEADGEDELFKKFVGSVVLNRVSSQYFPDNIHDVVFQEGQYACVHDGNFDKIPTEESYRVAEHLLINGSMLPPQVIWQAEFRQGDGIYIQMGNTKFCYSNNY